MTYGTNNEFGFDYLRDNMKYAMNEMVQRGHYYAIVDEVNSILIDEARTPLIISGPLDDRSELYNTIDTFIPKLGKDDYELDEKTRVVTLTEAGNEHVEQLLTEADMLKGESLYDIENVTVVHHVQQALRAHTLFQRDRDYIVKNDEVIIIDEFTGRMMQGRRYSEGLHQALEAKEHVTVQPENQTLASITFQNYFRLYEKLAGMTGTAATEADEFIDIYGLDVVEVPTNMDMIRDDEDDEVYRTAQEKYRAIITLIKDAQKRGQPMLVGTTSIEKSEILSELLKKDKVPHQVLNARYHEQEAHIIAQAGVPGAVTIATNMAGRGTDIQLGGNLDMRLERVDRRRDRQGQGARRRRQIAAKREEIKADIAKKKEVALAAGGLYVIGTERHESRRIDNQLRGRSGRQGDPGRSRFFLSLEDDLMRIFGSQRMDGMLQALGLKEDEAIIHPWINKALEKAQAKVEARNFDIRKNLLKYDNVMNDQRKAIFEQRLELMSDAELGDTIGDMRHQVIDDLVAKHVPEKAFAEQWDVGRTAARSCATSSTSIVPIADWAKEEGIDEEEVHRAADHAPPTSAPPRRPPISRLPSCARSRRRCCCRRSTICGASISSRSSISARSSVCAATASATRSTNIRARASRCSSTCWRACARRSPASSCMSSLPSRTRCRRSRRPSCRRWRPIISIRRPARTNSRSKPRRSDGRGGEGRARAARAPARQPHGSAPSLRAPNPADPSTWGKVQRNALCPCGSGKKYKHCHGTFG